MQAASAGNARVDDVPGAQGANAEETLDSGHQPGYAAASVTLAWSGRAAAALESCWPNRLQWYKLVL
jgi:hypothetical protein